MGGGRETREAAATSAQRPCVARRIFLLSFFSLNPHQFAVDRVAHGRPGQGRLGKGGFIADGRKGEGAVDDVDDLCVGAGMERRVSILAV